MKKLFYRFTSQCLRCLFCVLLYVLIDNRSQANQTITVNDVENKYKELRRLSNLVCTYDVEEIIEPGTITKMIPGRPNASAGNYPKKTFKRKMHYKFYLSGNNIRLEQNQTLWNTGKNIFEPVEQVEVNKAGKTKLLDLTNKSGMIGVVSRARKDLRAAAILLGYYLPFDDMSDWEISRTYVDSKQHNLIHLQSKVGAYSDSNNSMFYLEIDESKNMLPIRYGSMFANEQPAYDVKLEYNENTLKARIPVSIEITINSSGLIRNQTVKLVDFQLGVIQGPKTYELDFPPGTRILGENSLREIEKDIKSIDSKLSKINLQAQQYSNPLTTTTRATAYKPRNLNSRIDHETTFTQTELRTENTNLKKTRNYSFVFGGLSLFLMISFTILGLKWKSKQ